jgi:pimeloyl-ACP methyl ester carboxylesterase
MGRWLATIIRLALGAALLMGIASTVAAADNTAPVVRTITHEQIEKTYATAQSRFATIDGVRLHYKDQGHGPAVLLIHGSIGDTIDWDGWVDVLSPTYRVIRVDLPGFGLSGEISNGNYSIDRTLSLIDGLMDTLGVETFAIVGVSYGGPVAFRYAATRTERISALIIMNSAGIEMGKQPVDKATGKGQFYANISSDAPITQSFMEAALARSFVDPGRIPPGMMQRKLDMMNVIDRGVEGQIMVKQYVRGDPERVLSHVNAPTLVLWGGSERSLSLSTADRFADALIHAKKVVKVIVPGGDHFMHVELARQTATIARAFLDANISSAPEHH